MKNLLRGKIISLVGSPASGKSFLANLLAKELGGRILFEHPSEGFPEQIKYNLEKQMNLLETILWFRNRQIKNHLLAQEMVLNNDTTVILDTPFLSKPTIL
jgi:Predicted ATPase/kinase involved in NAD metabolism